MKKTLSELIPKSTTSRKRMVVICTLIVMIVGLVIAGAIMFSRAKATAHRMQAHARLFQMGTALLIYESEHGTLPPLYLRDHQGNPSQSWRGLILPTLMGHGFSMQLDISQPWNSDSNRKNIASVPPDKWVWFARTRSELTSPVSTRILAYLGRESIWEASTGLPKGKTTEHPGAILLLWVSKSNLHPLQPGDITEEQVRERIRNGQEVLFITAGRKSGSGIVTIERGELTFHTKQQVLDRMEGRQ